jgi:hypothetical protein
VTEKDGRRPSRRTTASTGGGGGRGPASGALVHLLQRLTGAGRRRGVGEEAQEGQEATSRADGWFTGGRGGRRCEGQPTETEDDASGAGSSGEAARAVKVYL